MSRGPRAGSIRPRIAGERLTAKQRRALLLVANAGYIDDRQLEALLGGYGRNVIKSLDARQLIRQEKAPGVRDWTLTRRGRELVPDVKQFAEGS
jgi:hypothetical protein